MAATPEHWRRPSASAAAASSRGNSASSAAASGPAADRFSLLLLEDGEYLFSSHTAYHWPAEEEGDGSKR